MRKLGLAAYCEGIDFTTSVHQSLHDVSRLIPDISIIRLVPMFAHFAQILDSSMRRLYVSCGGLRGKYDSDTSTKRTLWCPTGHSQEKSPSLLYQLVIFLTFKRHLYANKSPPSCHEA